MSPKTDKPIQDIQNIQQFIADRGQQDPNFAAVARKLGSLTNKLKSGKLLFQIVSQSSPLAYAVAKLTGQSPTLPALYQFQTANLPEEYQQTEIPIHQGGYQRTELAVPEPVILQFTDSRRQEPISHPLPNQGKLRIGRRPDCQIQIPNEYSFASGHHAEIIPIANSEQGNASKTWQICDTSSNGTYINGERIQGCHTLQPDDRIVLGYPEPTDRSPELIFKFDYNVAANQSHPHAAARNPLSDPNEQLYEDLIECDILCVVINPTMPLSNPEKQLIERAARGQLFKTIALVDVSASDRAPETVSAHIDALKQWLKSQNLQAAVALPLIPLHPFYPNPQPTSELDANVQQECDRFLQFLEQSALERRESFLIQRVAGKVKEQLGILERAYAEKEAHLKNHKNQSVPLPPGVELDELDRQIRKAFKQVADDKERSLRQIRLELNQSKAALIDAFSKESLLYKIKQFTDDLQPVVTKEKDRVSLQLDSPQLKQGNTIHTYMNRLCYGEMSQWAKDEWERVYSTYAEGGLQGVFQRTHAGFDFIPGLDLPSSSFTANSDFDVYQCLQYSFVEFDNQVSYQDKASGNNLMLLGSAAIGAVGLAMGYPILLMSAGMGVLGKQVAQKHSETSKIEQITENLRKGLCHHYQSLARSIADKLSQQIHLQIEAEERHFKTLIESTSDKIGLHMSDMKKSVDNSHKSQKNLQEEKRQFMDLRQKINW